MKVRKGLLNEVSMLVIRATWERCRWAKGKEEGKYGWKKGRQGYSSSNKVTAMAAPVCPASLEPSRVSNCLI